MNFTNKQILYGAGFLLTGFFLGWLLFSGPGENESQADLLNSEEMEEHIQDTHTNEEGEIIYTCSMHPQVRENEPGNCPICGMELIPVSTDDGQVEKDDYSMVMSEAAVKLAQVQTAPVTFEVPEKIIELPGRVQVDERNITNVTAYFPGRIQNIKVNFTGAQIRKGEPMATIYSPELISAQRELLQAARQQERNPRLFEAARQKFRLWGFTDEQINEIVNRGEVQQELEIRSPVDGYVMSRNVANQQYVTEGTIMYEVADLRRVWVVLEAYEEDIFFINSGNSITVRIPGNPGQTLEAEVAYIDPVVNPETRTAGIRADVENENLHLKPDMLVKGTIQATMGSEKLLIPASSVLWTGKRSLLYVKDTSVDVHRFEVREVELGIRAGDYYIIEEGVEEGEEVVFHGNFRIDSEFQLADKFSMMNREPGTGAGMPSMPGMDMGEEDMNMDEMEDHSNQ
ncbi:MAG: efflux RND transporter periplasmic adaptor subunit [Balneolaceae bacterium]